jgi:hypothetical protein
MLTSARAIAAALAMASVSFVAVGGAREHSRNLFEASAYA